MTNEELQKLKDSKHYLLERSDSWTISCERWFSEGKYISLPLNPEQIDFQTPLRVAHDDGFNAKYIYIWRRRRTNSMNNTIQIAFSLSSANVIPAFDLSTNAKAELAARYTGTAPPSIAMAADHRRGVVEYTQASVSGIYNAAVPIGVSNLYALLALADERRIRSLSPVPLGDGRYQVQQTSNRIIMAISTMIFPRMLLYGWFTPDGISIQMNADNPAEFTVNFSLMVTGTSPQLGFDGWRELTESYKKNMFAPMRTVDWLASKTGRKSITTGLETQPRPNATPISGQLGSDDLTVPYNGTPFDRLA